jgi:disulfide bond formation protein DsbB
MSLSPRLGNFLGFGACAGLMVYALYAQHVLELDPCPLCILQRMAVISLGVVFAMAAGHGAGRAGRRVYGVLIALAAAAGIGVAGRHVWLQNLPPEKVPACGPGLEYMLEAFPLRETLQMVLSGSGECASVDWSLIGLSMPVWVLIAITCLGVFGIWNNWRPAR